MAGLGVATVAASLDDLYPGDYILQITVESGGQEVNRRGTFSVRESGINPPPWVYINPRNNNGRQTELSLADQHVARGDDDRALESLRNAIRNDPDNLEARQRLAAFYLKRKNYEAAVKAIDPIIIHGQPTAYEFLLLGLGRSGAGNTEGAIKAYEMASADSPENTRILNLLGEERMHAGRNEAAANALRRSLDIEPDQPTIRVMLVDLAGR